MGSLIVERIFAWLLGPKAENEHLFEDLLKLIVRDYIHWRRNYFPKDRTLIRRRDQSELKDEFDEFYEVVFNMLGEMRRNFPFYSPRYIAHMQSEVTLPSLLGFIMGLLYNPNNVSSESSPVTTDWEIEAGRKVMELIGYTPPPDPNMDLDKYLRALKKEFGWAHITSGGTIANLEALWAARNVRYTALAIKEAAESEKLELYVKMPNGEKKLIYEVDDYDLLLIKPNEAIYLLSRFVRELKRKYLKDDETINNMAMTLIKKASKSISKGFGRLFSEFPPTILTSGTSHYSIEKIADVLGIGRENVIYVDVDDMFRMDVNDLEKKLWRVISNKMVPLAVIATLGTTEEGSVDPLHEIVSLREKMESERGFSFWIHADAAWGGFIKTILNFEEDDKANYILSKIAKRLGFEAKDVKEFHESFKEYLKSRSEHWGKYLEELEQRINKPAEYLRVLQKIIFQGLKEERVKIEDFELSVNDYITLVRKFTESEVTLEYKEYVKKIKILWGVEKTVAPFLALKRADSVTIDPHKMGYTPYPCGMVAFKNDRVRHFIAQEAPYITSVSSVHMPPKHKDLKTGKTIITSFGPFILEGSKPGAAASALWLQLNVIPLTNKGHGLLVRNSLLAARLLWEWLMHWDQALRTNGIDAEYQFMPVTLYPPDTNIVIFTVKKKISNSLKLMNKLTLKVYEEFSIRTELGEFEYSYSQPFFLSKTIFKPPRYPFKVLKPFFRRAFPKAELAKIEKEYEEEGLAVLRAVVMNPYIWPLRERGQDLLREFMERLGRSAEKALKNLE